MHRDAPLPRVPRTVDAVVTHLRTALVDGHFPPGEHLPPERQLAASLGVSRLTLRAALARLEAEGLVRARQGDGVRALEVLDHAGVGVLGHFDLSDRPDFMRSLLELRRAVLVEAVASGCAHVAAEDTTSLHALAAEQAEHRESPEFAARDDAFWRLLLRATQAWAGRLLFNQLLPVLAAQPLLRDALLDDRERVIAGYTLVLTLLLGRDPEVVRTTLRRGFEAIDQDALRLVARRRRRGR